jgi:hypothetical protein
MMYHEGGAIIIITSETLYVHQNNNNNINCHFNKIEYNSNKNIVKLVKNNM